MSGGAARPSGLDALLDDWDASWPPETVETARGWRLRADPGAGPRPNSARPESLVQAVDDADLDAVEAFYRARGLPAFVQLSSAPTADGGLDAPAAEAALLRRGYALYAETEMREGAVSRAMAALKRRGPEPIEVRAPLAALDALWEEGRVGPARRGVMARADPLRSTAFIARDGAELAGAVFASVAGARVFAHALFVREGNRRRGVGAALTAAVAAYGARFGVDRIAAARLRANESAVRAFSACGMTPTLSSAYFKKSPAPVS